MNVGTFFVAFRVCTKTISRPSPRGNSIDCEPRLIKQRSQVQISSPFIFVWICQKKKKKKKKQYRGLEDEVCTK
jgi:hypothetical protein